MLISIGDGGNEVGMGKVKALVEQHITNGDKIAANTYCDHLIVSDTSNFGGYALVFAIIVRILRLHEKNDPMLSMILPSDLLQQLSGSQDKT
jgi:hypothetical protein